MSPAQGELRPQLLDRFGLSVNVATIPDTDTRARMVMDRLEYEADPDGFAASVEPEQQALRDKLVAATAALTQVGAAASPLMLSVVKGVNGAMI